MKKTLLKHAILLLFLLSVVACLYSALTRKPGQQSVIDRAFTLLEQPRDPDIDAAHKQLRLAEIALQRAKVRQKQERLSFYDTVLRGGVVAVIGVVCLSVVVIVTARARALVRQASVFMANIGMSSIPVHHDDLQALYPVLIGLTSAEVQASLSDKQDRAFQMTRQILESVGLLTRSLVGRRGVSLPESVPVHHLQHGLMGAYGVPSFRSLVTENLITRESLVLGFADGRPVQGTWNDLKTCAVAGKQGSGKTNTIRFLLAQSVLQGVDVCVLDPHRRHEQGLVASLGDLVHYLTVVNPFDIQQFFHDLNDRIDRRLNGQESCQPFLVVIEELATLSHSSAAGEIVTMLTRFTEETRKAQMFGLFSSQKWNAKRFQHSAEVRQCVNSSYIHKSKSSQADLLLEDKVEARRVQQLQRPGQAVLQTDYGEPQVIDIPLVRPDDVSMLCDLLASRPDTPSNTPDTNPGAHVDTRDTNPGAHVDTPDTAPGAHVDTQDRLSLPEQTQPDTLTLDWITAQMTTKHLNKSELAKRAGVSVSLVKKILRGERTLTTDTQQKFYEVLG